MQYHSSRPAIALIISLLVTGAPLSRGAGTSAPPVGVTDSVLWTNKYPQSVFAMFAMQPQRTLITQEYLRLVQQRRLAELEKFLTTLAQTDPFRLAAAGHYYNLACVQAITGKRDEALANLDRAVDAGFTSHAHMLQDPDLQSLQGLSPFNELVAKARRQEQASTNLTFRQGAWTMPINPAESLRAVPFAPGAVTNGRATVAEENTLWSAQLGGIGLVVHRFDAAHPQKDAPITKSSDAVGELLRAWQKEGTAAGLWGVIYDNHDRGHSNLATADFPQLTRLVYSDDAKQMKLDDGLQCFFVHTAERTRDWPRGCTVIGNTSEVIVNGDFWRSLPRGALTTPGAIEVVAAQYHGNHITCYPAHTDHNAGQKGDVFPANTPFFIISQGSSGSDQPFLRAAASTIAAFRPETRLALEERGLIAPTVQMLLRSCSKTVTKPEDYLTGRAHPTVFEASQLDVEKMVKTAHAMKTNEIPGLAVLRIQEAPAARPGVAYWSPFQELLLGSPCAVAFVARSLDYERRYVLGASTESDPNQRPLTFHWSVLRGNRDTIQIRPLNPQGSLVEITVPHHTPRPIGPGATLESSRVDIGLFTHNGVHYSAPSFFSVYHLDNETRVYDGPRLLSIEYKSPSHGGRYVDPVIEVAKDWKDDYRYDGEGRLLGWTRTLPGGKPTDYTRNGEMVLKKDAKGRAIEAVATTYRLSSPAPQRASRLEPEAGPTKVVYDYADDNDRLGKPRLVSE